MDAQGSTADVEEARGIDPGPLEESLNSVRRAREELGTTRAQFADEHLEDARTELIEAMKELDCSETREQHVQVGEAANLIDKVRCALAETESRS